MPSRSRPARTGGSRSSRSGPLRSPLDELTPRSGRRALEEHDVARAVDKPVHLDAFVKGDIGGPRIEDRPAVHGERLVAIGVNQVRRWTANEVRLSVLDPC